MINKKITSAISIIACMIVCAGDFPVMFIYDNHFPGYSQLFNSISSLGATNSPVSFQISTWWVILGFLMIIFAIGFRLEFVEENKYAVAGSWLIIIYGLGEGLGSGIFKADYINRILTTSGKIHDILGGIGITAVFLFILLAQKIFTKNLYPCFYWFSWIIFINGIIMLILFSFRFSDSENNFFAIYQGLWQRLLVINIYIYFIAISFIMFKKRFLANRNKL